VFDGVDVGADYRHSQVEHSRRALLELLRELAHSREGECVPRHCVSPVVTLREK
jgi:hypothetical protein